jgi:hypothetical protein
MKKPNYTVHPAPYGRDVPGFWDFNTYTFYAALFLPPIAFVYSFDTSALSYFGWLLLTFVPSYALYMWIDSLIKNWAFAQSEKVLFVVFFNCFLYVILFLSCYIILSIFILHFLFLMSGIMSWL